MKAIYVDCELAGPMGQRRIVTRSLDGLCDLRNACREAVLATPKDQWVEGWTREMIVEELVRMCLNPKPPLTAEVFQYDMDHGNISVILRMPRATALQITKETVAALDIIGNSSKWICKA